MVSPQMQDGVQRPGKMLERRYDAVSASHRHVPWLPEKSNQHIPRDTKKPIKNFYFFVYVKKKWLSKHHREMSFLRGTWFLHWRRFWPSFCIIWLRSWSMTSHMYNTTITRDIRYILVILVIMVVSTTTCHQRQPWIARIIRIVRRKNKTHFYPKRYSNDFENNLRK